MTPRDFIAPCRTSFHLFALLLLASCAAERPAAPEGEAAPVFSAVKQAHVPDFATKPFEPFSRIDAVAIAQREWRAFGNNIDDDPPDTHPDQGEEKPERLPGLWQRVGEYWWLGQDADRPAAGWTGKHDDFGTVFPPSSDESYAWSAAFISYIMRSAGAGPRFPYTQSHSRYINIAAQMAKGKATGWVVTAEAPSAYAPIPGDLICFGRGSAHNLRYERLPSGGFPSHCDIVVGKGAEGLEVIGGNVDDAVTLKHVPISPEGRIAGPNNVPYDTRYHWLVVLRILYDR